MEAEDYRPQVREDLSWTDVDDGGVVFDSSRDKIHTLNRTAAYVWMLADGSRTVGEIVGELTELSKEPYKKVFSDVRGVLELFRRENLLLSDHGSP